MTHKDIQMLDWVIRHDKHEYSSQYYIHQNKICCTRGIDLSGENLSELPYPFGEIRGTFYVKNNNLTSFNNFPTKLRSHIGATGNPNLVLPEYLNELILSEEKGNTINDESVYLHLEHHTIIIDHIVYLRTLRELKLKDFAD
jgi:hypothetical protein